MTGRYGVYRIRFLGFGFNEALDSLVYSIKATAASQNDSKDVGTGGVRCIVIEGSKEVSLFKPHSYIRPLAALA